jgi:putative FmdB family regulatory protein
MPIYEYECSNCHHQLEAIQKMSDDPLKECPECHKPTLGKMISASGFQLKGTGWYVTDYSAKGKAKAKEGSAEKSSSDKSSGEKS